MLGSSLPGLTRKSGLPDLRRITLRNSGKPELRCNPSIFAKTSHEEDGCAGRKRVYARLQRASARAWRSDRKRARRFQLPTKAANLTSSHAYSKGHTP